MVFKSISPFNQSVIGEYETWTDSQIQNALARAEKTYWQWRKTDFAHRTQLMHNLAALLRRDKEACAQLITAEMGKIITEARAEVEKSATHCSYYAEHTEGFLRDHTIPTEAYRSFISFEPLGCVVAIMPWNYPFWQVLRYAAPVVMAGNVTILKHAPNVFGCAQKIESLFIEAGFPEGIFQAAIVDTPSVERLISADITAGVTLTGSEYAGSQVASLAGRHIKKSVLELGGSDPFIVLRDADIEKAARTATQSRMMNAGQACICAKRFIVEETVAADFIQQFSQNIKALRYGDPLDGSKNMGPMARLDLAAQLEKQLTESLAVGAEKVVGGSRDACLFEPTLVVNMSDKMPIFQQETFGPLAAVMLVPDAEKAIEIANQHRYGLAASIWSKDIEYADRLARRIESGNVFINTLVRSDSRLPFGGVKKSGYGRELSEAGLKEWVNWKTILIEA